MEDPVELPRRKRIRLESYDYDTSGFYFVTVCTKEKRKILCDIRSDGHAGDVLIEHTKYGRAVLEQLEYMKKGGRCSTVAALGANLLKLKPSIEVRDGKMGVAKKYRGSLEKCLRD